MSSLATTLAVAAVSAAVVGIVFALRRTRDRAPALLDVTLAIVVATVAMLVALAVRRVVSTEPLQPFGTFHALYDGVLVTLPLIGLVLGIVAVRRRSGPWTLSVCGVLVLLGALGWYMTHIEPNWLRVDTVDVPVAAARAGDGPVRIAVLADLQTGEVGDHERAAVQAIMDGEPDLIVIPGDLYQPTSGGYVAGIEGVRELLATLEAPHGVYFTQGDHEDMALARTLLEDTGIQILDDEVVEIPVRGRRLLLGGTSSSVSTEEGEAVRARLDAEPEDGAITVQVSHRPDAVLHLPDHARVDLTIAGHTHGGQVVVPGFGPPLTLTEVPRDAARGGLHAVDGNQLYVSSGVGLERGDAPQLRLFNRPSIALLDLGG